MSRWPAARVAFLAPVAGLILLLSGPALGPPLGVTILGHAQILSSSPGAGQVVAGHPTEIRLVFSEPLDPRLSSLDLLDGTGRAIVLGVGAPDPADPTVLVAPINALGDGIYTVNWRSLSAADGHATAGSFSFGVGAVSPPPIPGGGSGSVGSLHAGHDEGQVVVEVQGRSLLDLGYLLAFGLAVFAAAVVVPVRPVPSGLAQTSAIGLLAAAAGAAILILSAPGSSDLVSLVTQGRNGQLLGVRVVAGIVGGIATFALAGARPLAAARVGGVAGLIGLAGIALGGHSASTPDPGPVLALIVHLGAAGIWLAGVAGLCGFALSGFPLREHVPRFSATALVSIALVAITGLYAATIQVGGIEDITSQYGIALLVKIGLAAVALAIGAVNYFDGGRDTRRIGTIRGRLVVESIIGVVIVVAAANLASGSPPGPARPVDLALTAGGAPANGTQVRLTATPGRAGPNLFAATIDPLPAGATVTVDLVRQDQSGTASVPLRATSTTGSTTTLAADGILLPADSQWNATVVVAGGSGDLARARFSFQLVGSQVGPGRAGPPIDPGLAIALLLLASGVLAVAFAIAGGSLPRVQRQTGRAALAVGGATGTLLAIGIVLGGAR